MTSINKAPYTTAATLTFADNSRVTWTNNKYVSN